MRLAGQTKAAAVIFRRFVCKRSDDCRPGCASFNWQTPPPSVEATNSCHAAGRSPRQSAYLFATSMMSILVFNAGSTSLKFGLFPHRLCVLVSGSLDWADGKSASRDADAVRRQGDGGATPHGRRVRRSGGGSLCASGGAGDRSRRRLEARRHPGRGAPCRPRRRRFLESVLIDGLGEREHAGGGPSWPRCTTCPPWPPFRQRRSRCHRRDKWRSFDTAFFARLPPRLHVFPLPHAWYSEWGIRRFGFHGISHQYCAGRAAEILRRDPVGLRHYHCHLGGGCSAAAIRGNVAVASTLGFSTWMA